MATGVLAGMLHLLTLFFACADPEPIAPVADPPDVPPPTLVPPTVAPIDIGAYARLDELPCSADQTCVEGDALVVRSVLSHSESVDVAADDAYLVSCSGFGAAFAHHAGNFETAVLTGLGNRRCQRIQLGPTVTEGQIVYLAHHGDGWVPAPTLWTYLLRPDGTSLLLDTRHEGVLYEDMAFKGDWLYVATHATGVHVYHLDEQGIPAFQAVLPGFTNAVDIELHGNVAYVLDAEELVVLDIANPALPVEQRRIPLEATGRDLSVSGDVLYVAVGTRGLQFFDVSDPALPIDDGLLRPDGSVQSVKANETMVAISNWTHVSVVDPTIRKVVATERTRDRFEQDLGVAVVGDHMIVSEWNGLTAIQYLEGRTAPDLWIDQRLVTFPGDRPNSTGIDLRNRGQLPLTISAVSTEPPFESLTDGVVLQPGEQAQFTVAFTGEAGGISELEIFSDDPDARDARTSVTLHAGFTSALDVGDTLTDAFAFLDPTGQNNLSNLEGKVVVLAYFALF